MQNCHNIRSTGDRLLHTLLSRIIRIGSVLVRTAAGSEMLLGNGSGAPIALRFHDAAAPWTLIRDPDMQLGELFMDGRLSVEDGTIYDFIFLLLENLRIAKPPLGMRALDQARFQLRRFKQLNFPDRSRRNVAHHYDLDARLYRLFLDPDLQYSCAYFEYPGQSLADAQLAKKRHIAAKLRLEPGHRVLDIGCGWGGLADIATDVSVRGITLSEEQLRVARARNGRDASKVEFVLEDYRDARGLFDRIVSVGMFEHVGVNFYESYFAKCRDLLADQGTMLLHTIGCSDVPGFVTPWLDKYIFPGGYIPSLSEIVPVIERQGLRITDIEILHTHYALTLRAWREAFTARRAEVAQLYDERFCRMWEFYLASAEAAFRCENLVVFQIQLAKQEAITPMTRDYIHETERALRPRAAAG